MTANKKSGQVSLPAFRPLLLFIKFTNFRNTMSVPGRRVLPSLIDQRAQSDPDKAWASIQNSDNSDFTDISFSTFANAINRTS